MDSQEHPVGTLAIVLVYALLFLLSPWERQSL